MRISEFETNNMEFKVKLDSTNRISWLKKVCAFANELDGGTIIVGVSDDREIIGIKNVDDHIDLFVQSVKNSIYPKVIYSVKVETINKKIIIVFTIERGKQTPYTLKESNGKHMIYVMQGNTTVPASQSDLVWLVFNSSNISWDKLSQLDKGYYTFDYLKSKYYEVTGESYSDKDIRELGLIENDKITNAGILFSDQNTNDNAYISVTKWPGLNKASDSGIIDKEFRGSILKQIDYALETIDIYNKTQFNFNSESPQRSTEVEYDTNALKEALINAVVHRDYSIYNNQQVEVGIYDNRIEIKSTGSLLNGFKVKDLLNFETIGRRNPLICNILKDLKYIEARGRGIDRIISPKHSWLQQPQFISTKNFFQVTLYSNFNKEEVISEDFIIKEETEDANYLKLMSFLIEKGYVHRKIASKTDI